MIRYHVIIMPANVCSFVVYVVVYSKFQDWCQRRKKKEFKPEI